MRPLCPLPGGQGHKLGPLPLSCLGGRNCRLEPGPSHLLRLAPHLSGPQVPVHITGPLVPTSRLRRRQGSELMWVRAGVWVRTHLLHQLSWSWNRMRLTGAPHGELSLIPKAGVVHTSAQRGVQGCAGKAADAWEVQRWGCCQAETPS